MTIQNKEDQVEEERRGQEYVRLNEGAESTLKLPTVDEHPYE